MGPSETRDGQNTILVVEPASPFQKYLRLFILGLILGCLLWGKTTEAVEFIANPSVSVKTLSLNKARAIFYMRGPEWSDGSPVTVIVLEDDNPLHRQFSKQNLHLFPYRLRRVWDRNLFSGTGPIPEVVKNSREMINRVASTPGAVGYADKESIDEGVQIIEIR
jgi:hypothetical protein